MRSNVGRSVVLVTAALGVVAGLVAQAAPAVPAVPAVRISSRTLLTALRIAAPHSAGYAVSEFKVWDSQGFGCTTRQVVLITESVIQATVSSQGCRVTGRWRSPYDGKVITKRSGLYIDHLVPLAEAWQSGAWRWTATRRENFANDIGYAATLIAISPSAHRAKGSSSPSAYLPPRKTFDCRYEAWWVAVKWRWRLAVDAAEKAWLTSHLRACGWPAVSRPERA